MRLPQDERVVVELVILSIQEEHLPDLRLQALEALGGKIDVGVLRGALYDLGEVVKALDRGKPVALQDDLAFKVLNVVEWMAIAVGSFFEIGNPFGLALFLRTSSTCRSSCLSSYFVSSGSPRLGSTLRVVIEEREEKICGGSFERRHARRFVLAGCDDQEA